MKTIHIPGDFSPYENYYHTVLPSLIELTRMRASDLTSLGSKLAHAYTVAMAGCDMAQTRDIVSSPKEFGIELKRNRNSTLLSLAARLKDRKWWGRQITQLADEMREHQAQMAGLLGGKHSAMSCCSDATVEIFRERKERTDYALKSQFKAKMDLSGNATVFSLYDIAESSKKSRLNEMFLNIKALETIAESNSYGCAFITLTAAPKFHSNPKRGKNTYDGSTAREANASIQKDWRSILDGLDNIGVKRKSGSYFGFRVVELHEDGCPQWHILLFFDKTLGIIESVEASVQRLYKNRGRYFEGQKDDIIRIIEKTDEETAKPSSYIFKYIAYALGADEADGDGLAYRYKCAIRAMRARQYGFFGIKCAMGKQRALKSIARAENTPEHISKMAKDLYLPKGTPDRNAKQLQARVRFLEVEAEELEVSQEAVENRYGETVCVNRWIKHRCDDDAVQFAGLCEDITEEEAKHLMELKNPEEERGKAEAKFIERRRIMMQWYCDYLDELKEKAKRLMELVKSEEERGKAKAEFIEHCDHLDEIKEKAKRLMELKKPEEERGKVEPVTIVVNYSSKSAELPKSPHLLQRLRTYKQDQELATMLGLNLSELYSNGIVTRSISSYTRPRSAFSAWCRNYMRTSRAAL